jgi:hypothetical protein
MPPFEYKPFVNPYMGSIAQLMGAGGTARAEAFEKIGAIKAREAEQRGQAWATGIQKTGAGIAQGIGDWRQEQIDAPIREEEARARALGIDRDRLAIADAERQNAERTSTRDALGKVELVADEETGIFMYPKNELQKAFIDGGIGDKFPSVWSTLQAGYNATFEYNTAVEGQEDKRINARGLFAQAAIDAGESMEVVEQAIDSALRNGIVTQEEADSFLSPMQDGSPLTLEEMHQRLDSIAILSPDVNERRQNVGDALTKTQADIEAARVRSVFDAAQNTKDIAARTAVNDAQIASREAIARIQFDPHKGGLGASSLTPFQISEISESLFNKAAAFEEYTRLNAGNDRARGEFLGDDSRSAESLALLRVIVGGDEPNRAITQDDALRFYWKLEQERRQRLYPMKSDDDLHISLLEFTDKVNQGIEGYGAGAAYSAWKEDESNPYGGEDGDKPEVVDDLEKPVVATPTATPQLPTVNPPAMFQRGATRGADPTAMPGAGGVSPPTRWRRVGGQWQPAGDSTTLGEMLQPLGDMLHQEPQPSRAKSRAVEDVTEYTINSIPSDATKHGGLRGLYGYVTRNRDKFEEANIDTENYLQAILRFAEGNDSENYVGSIAGLTGPR